MVIVLICFYGVFDHDILLYDVGVKRWLKKIRLVSMHKHLGHALAQSSLAAVLRALKTSAQVPAARNGPAVVCAY